AALLKILHLPLANLLLHLGVSAHVGIELGFLIVLRGKSSKNRRRVLISPFLLLILTRFDLFSYDESLLVKWGFVVLIIAISAFITYSVIRRKLKELT
ncbi:MAG: hypothetical protein JJ975_13525, partial [Bacteroidia bacterium]|nr:hypothetical protein [Bacteroidia bacterium]